MTEIVLEIRGGVLVEAYSGNPRVRITVVDWDNIEGGGSHTSVGEVPCVPFRQIPPETAEIIRKSRQYP